jgi:1,4-dihydroxy-6-naphthoate synthase
MKIRIAHSPDSDDAFMFYALAAGFVPSNGFELEHVLSDIETLNRAAFKGTYEVTAV